MLEKASWAIVNLESRTSAFLVCKRYPNFSFAQRHFLRELARRNLLRELAQRNLRKDIAQKDSFFCAKNAANLVYNRVNHVFWPPAF